MGPGCGRQGSPVRCGEGGAAGRRTAGSGTGRGAPHPDPDPAAPHQTPDSPRPPGSRQELLDKAPQLPGDIEWHFIGHLQSNKVQGLPASAPQRRPVGRGLDACLQDRPGHQLLAKRGAAGRVQPIRSFHTAGDRGNYECPAPPPQVKALVEGVPNLSMVETVDSTKARGGRLARGQRGLRARGGSSDGVPRGSGGGRGRGSRGGGGPHRPPGPGCPGQHPRRPHSTPHPLCPQPQPLGSWRTGLTAQWRRQAALAPSQWPSRSTPAARSQSMGPSLRKWWRWRRTSRARART
jgi:hypothetical protein